MFGSVSDTAKELPIFSLNVVSRGTTIQVSNINIPYIIASGNWNAYVGWFTLGDYEKLC